MFTLRSRVTGLTRMYSAEWLYALDEYCKSTSRLRVFLVMSLYCTPALVLMLILDAVPLQDPSEGWDANPTFWMRQFVCGTVTVWGVLLEAQLVVPDMQLSAVTKLAIASAHNLAHIGAMMCGPLLDVPDSIHVRRGRNTVRCLPQPVCGGGGGARLSGPESARGFFDFSNFIGLQMTILIVYSAYNAAFLSLTSGPQLIFVLLLPGIKFGFKLLIVKL